MASAFYEVAALDRLHRRVRVQMLPCGKTGGVSLRPGSLLQQLVAIEVPSELSGGANNALIRFLRAPAT
jgi:hypothetical protein